MRFELSQPQNAFQGDGTLDRGVLTGAALCGIILLVAILFSGSIFQYFDPESFVLVLGGTVGATLIHYSLEDLHRAIKHLRYILFTRPTEPTDRVRHLLRLSQQVRENGFLVLDHESKRTDDPFLRIALEMSTDAPAPEEIRRVLENEIQVTAERTSRTAQIFQTMGGYAPAMGLIGTLVGLIQMLTNLKDPATVGPAMSLALVATLYGAITSNLLFLPLAGKIRLRAEEELLPKQITIEGLISITKQESTVILEQKLQAFHSPLQEL
jgi:chemotaxis protein MotA